MCTLYSFYFHFAIFKCTYTLICAQSLGVVKRRNLRRPSPRFPGPGEWVGAANGQTRAAASDGTGRKSSKNQQEVPSSFPGEIMRKRFQLTSPWLAIPPLR